MDDFQTFIQHPNQDLTLSSLVPAPCLSEPVMMGIDEAGRGPVLGPMVYGIAYFPVSQSKAMERMEFADSKALPETKRERIFESILRNKDMGWSVTILSPNTISNTSLRRRKYNLNALSHDTAIELVKQAMARGIHVAELYVDTVGPKEKYQQKLKGLFPQIGKIKVENKADSLFHVVSAASICAKVIRDKTIREWCFPEGAGIVPQNIDYGSGYPGDPSTKAFLKKALDPVFGFPTFVRFCWSTAQTIVDDEAVDCEWEQVKEDEKMGDEETADDKKNRVKSHPMTKYFKRAADNSPDGQRGAKRHCGGQPSQRSAFFLDRDLKRVTCLREMLI